MTKQDFLVKQVQYVNSIAIAANSVIQDIQITDVTEVFRRSVLFSTKRFLLGTSVQVQTSVKTSSDRLTSLEDQSLINSYLNQNGLPNGTLIIQDISVSSDRFQNLSRADYNTLNVTNRPLNNPNITAFPVGKEKSPNYNVTSIPVAPSMLFTSTTIIALAIGCFMVGIALSLCCRYHRLSEAKKISNADICIAPPNLQESSTQKTVASACSGSWIDGATTLSFLEVQTAASKFAESHIIGRGCSGFIYRGEWNQFPVAVKVLGPVWFRDRRDFIREVQFLCQYRHQCLMQLLAFHTSRNTEDLGQSAYVVHTLMTSSLDKILKAAGGDFKSETRLQVAFDIAEGLNYLHNPGKGLAALMHRDMRSCNVLLDSKGRAKISILGLVLPQSVDNYKLAQQQSTILVESSVLISGYIDPEHCNTGHYTFESDIFALGVIFLELLTGEPAVSAWKSPQNLHCRMRAMLPVRISDVADASAGWNTVLEGLAVKEFAAVAIQCVAVRKAFRPSTLQILQKLWNLIASLAVPPVLQSARNFDNNKTKRYYQLRPLPLPSIQPNSTYGFGGNLHMSIE